jgi:RimJ/RimL family protein N-acetyltransferase
VHLRELGPGEHAVVDAVFAGLSPLSRYRRFHTGTPRLGRAVRERLAAVDGRGHIAVAAFAQGRPIGTARLVSRDGHRADLAVEVVDAWHGRGVGGRLLRAVADLGRAAGLTEVVAEVLADNRPVLGLLVAVFPDLTRVADGPEVRITARLGPRAAATAA